MSFAKESQMRQHLEGPTHKKAVEKARKEEQRLQQLGNNRWAAENAAVCPHIHCRLRRRMHPVSNAAEFFADGSHTCSCRSSSLLCPPDPTA